MVLRSALAEISFLNFGGEEPKFRLSSIVMAMTIMISGKNYFPFYILLSGKMSGRWPLSKRAILGRRYRVKGDYVSEL